MNPRPRVQGGNPGGEHDVVERQLWLRPRLRLVWTDHRKRLWRYWNIIERSGRFNFPTPIATG